MTYPGTDLKFRVTVTQPDFQLSEDDFQITVRDHYGRLVKTVAKSDCFWDDEGRWYFTMDGVRRGIYRASFHGRYEDEDYDDQKRDFTDVQELCRVGYLGKTRPCGCHKVQYEQVWTVSVDGDDYLAECDGRYVLTGDGRRIAFHSAKSQQIEDMGKVRMQMTGEEFLKLIEGRDPNGVIDTVPEMLDAAQGISDEETIKDKIEEELDENTPERVTPEDLANFKV